MAGKSRKRGLDGSDDGTHVRTERRPRYPDLGVIGKTTVTDEESEDLHYLGRCIARFGHRLTSIPTKGTEHAVREGVKEEGGRTLDLETDVLGTADHTIVYPDERLLRRLLIAYPDLRTRQDVTIIEPEQLSRFIAAINNLLRDKNLGHPPRYPGGPR